MNMKSAQELERHINILGWLHIGLNALTLVIMVFVGFIMLGAGVLSGEAEAMGIMFIMAMVIGAIMLFVSVPGIIAGWGLLKGKNWARVLALVLGCLNILSFPFGTAVGIYTLWVLLIHEDSHDYFNTPKSKLAAAS